MTLNVYARPTEDGDRAAARPLGDYFLGTTTDPAPTRDAPGMEPFGSRLTTGRASARPGISRSGANWTRTSDLSIISAAL